MISTFPKIFSISTSFIQRIFSGEVEVSEKIDGSTFSFGKRMGETFFRRKGDQLFTKAPEKLFREGLAYLDGKTAALPDNLIFHCEYLKKPKHNALAYDRIPKNHFMLFGVEHAITNKFLDTPGVLDHWAEMIGIEGVPILFRGKINNVDELHAFLEKESVLGGQKIEGVVVKNYQESFLLGGHPVPIMAGKLVSEKFKETLHGKWGTKDKGKSRLETFFDSFVTEARWAKAIQHLRDNGELKGELKDIGLLCKEIHRDFDEEHQRDVEEFLWKEFNRQIKRGLLRGFPEFYKRTLAETTLFGEFDNMVTVLEEGLSEMVKEEKN